MGDLSNSKNIAWVVLGTIIAIIVTQLGGKMEFFLPLIVIGVGISLFLVTTDFVKWYYASWKMVRFSKWENLFPRPIWGGVRLENDTWAELKECEAELIEYKSDSQIKDGTPSVSELLRIDGAFEKLYWLVEGEYLTSTNIGRGKEGFIVLALGVEEDEKTVQVPKPNWIYKITTTRTKYYHLFDSGYLWIRISAKIKDDPLETVIKRIRLEVVDQTLYIKAVENG